MSKRSRRCVPDGRRSRADLPDSIRRKNGALLAWRQHGSRQTPAGVKSRARCRERARWSRRTNDSHQSAHLVRGQHRTPQRARWSRGRGDLVMRASTATARHTQTARHERRAPFESSVRRAPTGERAPPRRFRLVRDGAVTRSSPRRPASEYEEVGVDPPRACSGTRSASRRASMLLAALTSANQ